MPPESRMSGYVLAWIAVCITAAFLSLFQLPIIMIDFFANFWWLLLALLAGAFLIYEAYRTGVAEEREAEDTARLDALEHHCLMLCPPRQGDTFFVLKRDDNGGAIQMGSGGKNVRAAIDSALLAIAGESADAGKVVTEV